MYYKFRCECGNVQDISIPMSEYDNEKDKQTCKKCGKIMKRIIEFEGGIGMTGGYDVTAGKAAWQS